MPAAKRDDWGQSPLFLGCVGFGSWLPVPQSIIGHRISNLPVKVLLAYILPCCLRCLLVPTRTDWGSGLSMGRVMCRAPLRLLSYSGWEALNFWWSLQGRIVSALRPSQTSGLQTPRGCKLQNSTKSSVVLVCLFWSLFVYLSSSLTLSCHCLQVSPLAFMTPD